MFTEESIRRFVAYVTVGKWMTDAVETAVTEAGLVSQSDIPHTDTRIAAQSALAERFLRALEPAIRPAIDTAIARQRAAGSSSQG
ncbi:MAG TPA: hypothetical protein VF824_12855 [Thermoanaerobaculia bacterium]|jgi:hypothetical protein